MSMTAQFHAPIAVRYKDWTPRQKQVLDLLVRGQTNSQIAAALGISLDGAKWHVSEIITRLGVDSREEAADYWRTQNGIPARLFRAVRALIPGVAVGKAAAAAAVAVLFTGLVAAIVYAWPGAESDTPPADNTGSAPVPTPVVSNPQPNIPANVSLTNGTSGYSYTPTLSYLAPGNVVHLTDGTSAGGNVVLQFCSGLGSAKQNILTGGLRWSANGQQLVCLADDLSVRAADPSGALPAGMQLFAANECQGMFDVRVSPVGESVICSGPAGLSLRTTAGGTIPLDGTMHRVAFSPSGKHVIVAGKEAAGQQEGVLRVTWDVYSVDGTLAGNIADAYIADPLRFAWSLDGTKIAYPGDDGLTILDLENGLSRTAYPFEDISAGTGPAVTWVLDDTALLAHGGRGELISAADGSRLPLPAANYAAAKVAPDGRHVAVPVFDDTRKGILAIIDLKSGTLVPVPGVEFEGDREGMGPVFIFSGDSSRLCWMSAPGASNSVMCAETAGGPAFKVTAPVQVEPDVLGSGDIEASWRAFSPDLRRIAWTTPGLADPDAEQTLWVADLDGSNEVNLGPALGPIPYEWQPDGVYRPATTVN